MKLLFDVLWFLGIAAFLVFGFLGFAPISRLKRFLISLGLIASSMLAAAQGQILLIGFFWMFPVGFYYGLLQLRGINLSISETPLVIYIGGWIFYIIASGGYIFTSNSIVRRVVWGTLIVALLANIGGCQTVISDLKKI